MANDSSTGGYLLPAQATPPEEDQDLDAIFQKMIVGITGLDGQFVRPRWQLTLPKQPEASISWCSFAIGNVDPDSFPYIAHDPAANGGAGADNMQRHEEIELEVMFYGPGGQKSAAQLRDGLYIAQNSEYLRQYGIGVVEAGKLRAIPELVNEQWIRRYDVQMRFRRVVKRQYATLHLTAAPSQITANP